MFSDGHLGLYGKEIGTTSPNVKYLVLERKAVLGVTGLDTWIKVQPTDGSESGWAYGGPSRKGIENFEVVE